MEWFASDWHLGHANVVKYDKRPFKNIQENDRVIIDNFKSVVKPGDKFYYMGDFCLGSPGMARNYMMNIASAGAEMFFIKGNHDKKDTIKLYKEFGTFLGGLDSIKVGEQVIVLCHYGMRVWDRSHHGSWHLYGHSHGNLPEYGKSFDVGCMNWNYYPVSFDEIEEKMNKLVVKEVDHHKSKRK